MAIPKKKSPDPVDVHVGRRVRMRRMMLEMSQTALGEAVGITFQQIQKYEKGTNRISASRLQQMSDFLQVPVPFFFDGAPHAASGSTGHREPVDGINHFMATRDGLALAKAFMRIGDIQLRRRIVNLAEEIADHRSGCVAGEKHCTAHEEAVEDGEAGPHRARVDPYDFIRFMRQQGHTFRTIARDIPIWEENDPKKTPLTPSELKAWYEKETIRRKLRLCQQLFLKGGGASTTPYSKRGWSPASQSLLYRGGRVQGGGPERRATCHSRQNLIRRCPGEAEGPGEQS